MGADIYVLKEAPPCGRGDSLTVPEKLFSILSVASMK
jgi:hypothetical protein